MTWSLGKRLQSASVSSSPSRYLRLDSPEWPSSGRGLIRYSSSLARALSRLCSNAGEHIQVIRSAKLIHPCILLGSLWIFVNWIHTDSLLTSIFIWSRVFDISREPGKCVISSRVGFTILCCKFGIPKSQSVNMLLVRMLLALFLILVCDCDAYFGGASIASRYSSILLTSVRTSPWKVRKGGCVPGARLWRSAGFLIRVEPFYILWYKCVMECYFNITDNITSKQMPFYSLSIQPR